MEVFLRFAAMLLGILGAVQLGEVFSIWLRRPKERPSIFSVLPLSGEIDDVEQILGNGQMAGAGDDVQAAVRGNKADFLQSKRVSGGLQRWSG